MPIFKLKTIIKTGISGKKTGSLWLPFGTPCGNRTHNGPLGGDCYIHLTKEAKRINLFLIPKIIPKLFAHQKAAMFIRFLVKALI